MDGLLEILVLVAFLGAGALIPRIAGGRLAPAPRRVEQFLHFALWALLFAMGFRIGNDPRLSSRLGELGLLAAATAVLAVAGTIVAITLSFGAARLLRGLGGKRAETAPAATSVAEERGDQVEGRAYLRTPVLLLAIVAGGFAAGLVIPSPRGLDVSSVSGWALDILLFFVGMQFSQSGLSLRRTFFKPATLMVPLATAVGTLAFSLVLVPLFGLGVGKALALAAGFGWYSLSGVLISNLGDPALGSAAFLANMMREAIALLSIPFLARTRLPVLAVGVGGATSMDVTLPLIEQCAGPAIVPLSFASGVLLSLLVPFLVPFVFGLG